MVAIDGSPHAAYAVDWALGNLVDYDQDVLHLVSVARREPDKVMPVAPHMSRPYDRRPAGEAVSHLRLCSDSHVPSTRQHV